MDIFENVESIENLHIEAKTNTDFDFKHSLLTVYSILCVTGFLYGAAGGVNNWMEWMCRRSQLTIGASDYVNNLVDPMLNIGRDAGYLGWFVMTSGTVSAFIIATFPVSVPLLAVFSNEKSSTHTSKTRNKNRDYSPIIQK